MKIKTLIKKTEENNGHLSIQQLVEMGGVLHCSDSEGRELWSFPDDVSAGYCERIVDLDGDDPDLWSVDVDYLAGWFPDNDVEEWEDMVLG